MMRWPRPARRAGGGYPDTRLRTPVPVGDGALEERDQPGRVGIEAERLAHLPDAHAQRGHGGAVVQLARRISPPLPAHARLRQVSSARRGAAAPAAAPQRRVPHGAPVFQ
jgi:hypothetical protein